MPADTYPRVRCQKTDRQRGRLAAVVGFAILWAAGCAAPAAYSPPFSVLLPTPAAAAAVATAGPASQPATWYSLYFTTPAVTANLTNPTGGIPQQIAVAFDSAQHTIDLAMYQFDLLPLAEALLRAKQRGVIVRVVTDSDSFDMDGIRLLRQAGVPVVPDQRQPIMHDKFAVIDSAVVWTGSMNFTYSDSYRNDNNVNAIRSAELAQNYTDELEKMFADQ